MKDKDPTTPLVSIITAAYNRSNVLGYAIDSVRASTFEDWELLIVNDASTDDTAGVVGAYSSADPRIRLIELARNVGEQSGPNNEGFRHARGRYIAYISQDDLWFPDHLASLLASMAESGADWVFSLGFISSSPERIVLGRAFPDGKYSPRYSRGVPASFWLMKRSVLEDIGDWRACREIRLPPSQDLLMRAHRAGKIIRMSPLPTVIQVQSGSRPNVYSDRESEENRQFLEGIRTNPRFREQLLVRSAIHTDCRAAHDSIRLRSALRTVIWTAARRLALLLGIPPMRLYFLVRHFRKGSFINSLRRTRGLLSLENRK